jgi:hypothetical protein
MHHIGWCVILGLTKTWALVIKGNNSGVDIQYPEMILTHIDW